MRRGLLVALAFAVAAGVAIASAASLSVTTQGLTAFKTCTLEGSTSASTTDADNFVQQDKATQNNGTTTSIDASSASTKIRRLFVRFDLTKCSPAILSTATVKDARLRLSLATAPTSTRSYSAFRVTTPCPQGLSTCWGETTETWNNQPSTVASASDSVSLGSASALGYYSWTVTADAQAFVSGTASNYGWSVRDANEDGTTATAKFSPKEQNSATSGPQLVITYVP